MENTNQDQLANQLSENQDKDVRLDLDKPTDASPVTVVEDVPAAPAAPAPTEAADESVATTPPTDAPKKKGEVDPTFNCAPCVGEGMTFDHPFPEGKICSSCGGTGKIN